MIHFLYASVSTYTLWLDHNTRKLLFFSLYLAYPKISSERNIVHGIHNFELDCGIASTMMEHEELSILPIISLSSPGFSLLQEWQSSAFSCNRQSCLCCLNHLFLLLQSAIDNLSLISVRFFHKASSLCSGYCLSPIICIEFLAIKCFIARPWSAEMWCANRRLS